MNWPNRVSLFRILLIPVFMFLLFYPFPRGELLAAVVYLVAALSDVLDGYLARSRQEITLLGQFLDPLADKLLICSALISLVGLELVPVWIAVVIVGREVAITGLRTIAVGEGMVIQASWLGKVKTLAQNVAIVALMLRGFPLGALGMLIGESALYIATFITVFSGLDYLQQAARNLSNGK